MVNALSSVNGLEPDSHAYPKARYCYWLSSAVAMDKSVLLMVWCQAIQGRRNLNPENATPPEHGGVWFLLVVYAPWPPEVTAAELSSASNGIELLNPPQMPGVFLLVFFVNDDCV